MGSLYSIGHFLYETHMVGHAADSVNILVTKMVSNRLLLWKKICCHAVLFFDILCIVYYQSFISITFQNKSLHKLILLIKLENGNNDILKILKWKNWN